MSTSSAIGHARRWLAAPSRDGRWRNDELLLAILGAASLVVLIAQARTLVHGLYLNADNASALVLPILAGHAPAGATVNLGDHPWYEPWWFMRLTAGWPHYRQLWELAPFVFALLGIASVAACAYHAIGRWSALVFAALLMSASATLRSVLYVPEARVAMVLHSGVLCGALLLVYRRANAHRCTPSFLLALGVPLVAFTGAGSTDELVIAGGVVPFLIAPAWGWWRSRGYAWKTTTCFALAVAVISLLIDSLLDHIMHADHVVAAPFPISFVAANGLWGNFQSLATEFSSLAGGYFFGLSASGSHLLVFASGALALLALAMTLRRVYVVLSAHSAGAQRAQVSERDFFIAFWGIALAVTVSAFVLTSAAEEAGNGRYLLAAWVAVAALIGTCATTVRTRAAITIGVCLFCALTLRSEIADGVPAYGIGPTAAVASAIERFVTVHNAYIGYGSYWDSSPVTWETHLRVRVYPIAQCGTPDGLGTSRSGWCPFYNNQISSWYRSRARTHTFLITDARATNPLKIEAPSPAFGHPTAEATFGEFHVYIYSYDLATGL